MDPTASVVAKDAFAKLCEIEVIESKPGYARTRMRVGPQHCNGLGMVHGGAIFTLADYAFAAACNSHGYAAVAVNVNISFLKAPKSPVLFAEATEAAVEGKLGSCIVRVLDESGDLVAMFQGLSYRKGPAK